MNLLELRFHHLLNDSKDTYLLWFSFNKYLLSSYYVLDALLGTMNGVTDKTSQGPCPHETYVVIVFEY